MIAGLIFVFTAATYAEATTNFPEAGGSSSFARRAFNELVSFFAAWGQMLNYIITVAISAFFVPHYLGVFWEPLRHEPGRHHRRDRDRARAAVGGQHHRRTQESARLNLVLAVVDFATQLLLLALGVFLVLTSTTLIDNVHLGVAPTWSDFLALDHRRDDLLHGDRDDLEHGRGGARPRAD